MNGGFRPEDKPYTEIEAFFFGERMNPSDLKCYLRLLHLTKKFGMEFNPKYIIERTSSYAGSCLMYSLRTILNDETKINNAKAICNELIKDGIKNNYIPSIQLVYYGKEEGCKIYKLEQYLQNKGIEIKDLNIEDLRIEEFNKNYLEEERE